MSAQDNSMGYLAGVGNIWNVGPNECLINPAKLGYLGEGVSWSLSQSNYTFTYRDVRLSSSYIAANWNGLGVLAPCLNGNGNWGASIEQGETDIPESQQNYMEHPKESERDASFAFGVNLLEFIAAVRHDESMHRRSLMYDLSFGYQYTDYRGERDPYSHEDSGTKWSDYIDGLGVIGRFTPTAGSGRIEEQMAIDMTAAVYLLNPFGGKKAVGSSGQSSYLIQDTYCAIAANVRGKNNYAILPDFIQNIVALTVSADLHPSYDEIDYSYGVSAMILDIFSIRYGENGTTAEDYGVIDSNWGVGVNLNYRDLVQFKYDWSENGADGIYSHDYNEFTLRVNLLGIL